MSPRQAPAAHTSSRPARRRVMAVDGARGIAIALVVLSHAANVSLGLPNAERLVWFQAIVAVSMPLFVFISGFLMNRPRPTPLPDLVRGRAISLLVPYASWLVIGCAIDARSDTAAALHRLLSGVFDPYQGLWFLYVLFECTVLFGLLLMVSRSAPWLVASTLFIALALTAVPPHEGTLLGKLDVQFLLPFMAFGFVYAGLRPSWGVRESTVAVGALGLFAGLCILMLVPSVDAVWRSAVAGTGMPDVAVQSISRLLRYLLGLSGVVGLFAVAHVLRGWPIRVLAGLGVMSLGIYALHGFFLSLLAPAPWMPMLLLATLAMGLSVGGVLVLERWEPSRLLLLGTSARRLTGGGPWGDTSAEV